MITREQLKGAYSEGEALAIYHEVKSCGMGLAAFARSFMHDEDYQVARNALWGLTKATDAELSVLQPMMNELIDLAMSTDNPSVRRLSLNVVERLEVNEEDVRTDFLDFCFDRMVRLDEYPGIQSLCMKMAHRICSFFPELKDELIRTLETMEIGYYKPAVKSVRRRILDDSLKPRRTKH
ncbi:MAG: hypothetical protein KBT10_04105 [Bacteroidales bacterium]|nr:hypothetical protein [Candidatus Sodaliphilus aphodohippi]